MFDFCFCVFVSPIINFFEILYNYLYNEFLISKFLVFSMFGFILALLCFPFDVKANQYRNKLEDIKLNPYKLFIMKNLNLIIQIPIFIATYYFFINITGINTAEFFYLKNLAVKDSFILFKTCEINLLLYIMALLYVIIGILHTRKQLFVDKLFFWTFAIYTTIFLQDKPSIIVLYWIFHLFYFLIKVIGFKLKCKQDYFVFLFFFFVIPFIYVYNSIYVMIILFVTFILVFIWQKIELIKKILNFDNFLLCFINIYCINSILILIMLGYMKFIEISV